VSGRLGIVSPVLLMAVVGFKEALKKTYGVQTGMEL